MSTTDTNTPGPVTYAETRWPWRITSTDTDGGTHTGEYADDFDPVGYARHLSSKPGIARVEVTTSFVDGVQRLPGGPGSSKEQDG